MDVDEKKISLFALATIVKLKPDRHGSPVVSELGLEGFSLKWGENQQQVKFQRKLQDLNEANRELEKLLHKSTNPFSFFKVDPVLPLVAFVGLTLFFLSSLCYSFTSGIFLFDFLHDLNSRILGSNSNTVCVIALLAHIIEAFYSIYLTSTLPLLKHKTISWFFSVLLVGFPMLRWILQLEAKMSNPKLH